MKQYLVDVFAEKLFKGNPAAVCILNKWLPEDLIQNITKENNLSETAFVVKEASHYHLRWFTPGGEIDLCGHASLATAFVIVNYIYSSLKQVSFDTLRDQLTVTRYGDQYVMAIPSYKLLSVPVSKKIVAALGVSPKEDRMGRDLVCVLDNKHDIYHVKPNLEKAKDLPGLLVYVTAPGNDYDAVSRSFTPKLAIDEGPVCGWIRSLPYRLTLG